MPTFCTLIKRRHRLIRTPNLDHIEIRPIPPTVVHWTLSLRVIHIIPCSLAAHDIVDLFPLHGLPLVVAPGESEFIGAGAAFEAVLAGGGGAGDL